MKNLITLVLAFLLWTGNSLGAVNGYTFTNSSGTYIPITGGIVLGTIANDDQVFNANTTGATPPVTATGFPIGFYFTYNGIVYDKFAVNTNGWIVLGTGTFTIGASASAPISITGPVGFVSAISALGVDMQGQSGSELSFKTEGVAPTRVLTIQWSGYRNYNATGDNYNLQIKLVENSNEVRFIYGPFIKNATSRNPQVGIRGETNADFHNRTTTTNWAATSKGTINTQTCMLSQAVLPPEGLTFIFSPAAAPPNCANIVSPVDLATNVMISATLNWAEGSGGTPTGYKLYFGTDYPPTNIVNGTNLGLVTTFDPTPDMTYSMDYYWKIVPTNAQGDATGCPIRTFTTGPDPTIISFPFCESFDGDVFAPYEWTNLKTAGTGNPGTWNRQTTGTSPTCTPHSGAGMARYNSYNLANGTSGILATPPINFPTDQYRVNFWMFRDDGYPTYSNELVNVYYNTAPSAIGGILIGTIHRYYGLSPVESTANQWYEYNFDMPPGAGGDGRYVIFEAVSQYGNNMFLDDVCLVLYGETLINAGTDRYTVSQGTLTFGSSGTDYWPLPADFFGPGSDPFEGTIYLQGHNSDGSQTPDGDITINRTTDLNLAPPPSSGPVPTEMTQLSLSSSAPVRVNYDFQPDSFFDVFFEISLVPGMGMYDIALENQYGGTYSLTQSFQPVITFVNIANPAEVYTFTPESMGFPPLMLSSMAPYPWTLSPIRGEFDPLGVEEELILHTPAGSTFSVTPLLERTNNNTMVEMNEGGMPVSFSGNGYNNGEWFYYPNSFWWNVWWYDHPIQTNRAKWIINPSITIFPRYQQISSTVEIVYTYSTPQWYTWTIAPRPPLPSDVPTPALESELIQRSDPIFTFTGTINEPIEVSLVTPYIIPWYNPEWISIDIRGSNFILNGLLNHVCWRPATKSLDFGDAPAPYPTLLVNNGARHTIITGVFMGNLVDAEANGQPNANATGDDINPPVANDEDGVVFNTLLNPGLPAILTVQSSIANALLQIWIDFNADGDWLDAGEQIATNLVTVAGNNVVNYNVPAGAVAGPSFARFRLSTMPNLTFLGAAPNGEVEDHKVNIEAAQDLDFGDAPDPTYPTLLVSNGARHVISGLMLGVLIDAEPNGQPNIPATGDDINPAGADDEDGVWWACNFVPGQANTVKVTASGPGFLNAWFDFNRDGDWADIGEYIFNNVALLAGTTDLVVNVPANAVFGNTYARFRFSTQQGLTYTGLAPDGEVEDYLITIQDSEEMDYGDAPDPTYPTLAVSNGARHGHDPFILMFLGNLIDWEFDGQPDPNAKGDDLNNFADEEGVVFNTPLIPGAGAVITVTASIGGGWFQGWIDFNNDGDWLDAGEQIFTNIVLVAGPQPLNFAVPANALIGNSFARFRYSTMGNLMPYGCAPNGEVEDYAIFIGDLDYGDAPDPTYPTLFTSDGARHNIDSVTYLGNLIDGEADGLPSANATGDDLNNLDDEDGVTFLWPLAAGNPCKVKVSASVGDALLNTWIDFNRNGSWADPGEHIYIDLNLLAGDNYLTFIAPANVVPGATIARFRFSHQPALSFTGYAYDGEVEDYAVEISEHGDIKWLQSYETTLPGLHSDQTAIIADDWICGGGMVTDIHWWGNYELDDQHQEERGLGINFFLIKLYSNANCLPGQVLQTYTVPFSSITEVNTGYHNNEMCPIYYYEYDLDQPFMQIQGNIYWVSIQAISNNPDPPYNAVWRWQEANRWYQPVSCGAASSTPTAPWMTIEWYGGKFSDMAFVITSAVQLLDYGDAPDPGYPTLLVNNGARHKNTGLMLGVRIDVEPNGQPDGTATGDDLNPPGLNDEDGVWWACNFVPGHVNTVKVIASGAGFLNVWFDYNIDGDWADPGEQVFTDVALSAGTTDLFVNVPIGATLGTTFTRFRFSSLQNLSYTGYAADGEVEDYSIIIQPPEVMDYGDAPDPAYPTLAASNGARHAQDLNFNPVFLGNLIDWEIDGQPNATATGDDLNNLADEDGVIFTTPLIPGLPATINVTASIGGAAFQGWIDFDADGDWADAGEQIFNNVVLVAGPQLLNFNVPANAILGNTFARFRYSTMPNLSYYGCAPNGEVEDYRILIGQPDEYDWGDLPDQPYPTLAASNGPRHIVGTLFLGNLIDSEPNGQPHPVALGDDMNNLADEDGVVFTSQIMPGKVASVTVIASQGGGLLQGCIDLTRDGDFNDAGEQIFINQALAPGINLLTFTVNPAAQLGPTFARFRLSTVQNLGCTGPAPNGEVEDYHVMIEPAPPELDFGDAPDPTYPTLLASNGARHLIDNVTYLGPLIDGEANGQPTPNADGDDLTNLADEDGVVFMWPLAAGNPCKLKVTASVGDALFNGWIDFNGNGSWADPGEHVFVDLNLLAGDNYLTFITPCNAVPGQIYSRFRFSHQPALSFAGDALDGEVEDYAVQVIEYGDIKWQQPPDPLLPGMHAGEGTVLADDWICCGDVVTDIHWWGNYEVAEGGVEKRGLGINHFLLHIYSNANCMPNAILKTYVVPFNPALEINTGQMNNEGSWIYKYDFLLPEPFIQVKDTTYWLSVQVISNDPQDPPYWRWQESNRWLFPIHCGAAMSAGTQWFRITWPFPPLVKYDDFAFAITSWVVDTLHLQNIEVTSGQDVCYDANKVIIVAGGGSAFNVLNGGRATLIAGEKIQCLPVTRVYAGGYMHCYITTPDQFCNSLKTAMVASAISTPETQEIPEVIARGAGFKVYPNPTNSTFTVEVAEMGEINVDIYSMFGAKLLEKKVSGQFKYEFSLTSQPPGVYILHVITGKNVGTVKIIKH